MQAMENDQVTPKMMKNKILLSLSAFLALTTLIMFGAVFIKYQISWKYFFEYDVLREEFLPLTISCPNFKDYGGSYTFFVEGESKNKNLIEQLRNKIPESIVMHQEIDGIEKDRKWELILLKPFDHEIASVNIGGCHFNNFEKTKMIFDIKDHTFFSRYKGKIAIKNHISPEIRSGSAIILIYLSISFFIFFTLSLFFYFAKKKLHRLLDRPLPKTK